MPNQPDEHINIFYCYARKDKSLRDRLDVQLGWYKRRYQLTSWYDREIFPGQEWEYVIDKHLNAAHLILLLISPDFMNSDYCLGKEMHRALERHQEGSCWVIPILMRPTNFEGAPFSHLQLLPKDAKPITSWSDRDKAFESVVTEINRIVKDLLQVLKMKEEWSEKARTFRARKQDEEALTAYNEVIRLSPSDVLAYYNKGNILRSLERYEEALVAYDQAIHLDPDNVSAYGDKGLTLYKLKQYKEALTAYDEVIRLNPKDTLAYHNKGLALHDLGRYKEELMAYDKAIDLDPNDSDAYYNKGLTLYDLGQYKEALTAYDEVIRLDPNDIYAYDSKGLSLHELKEYEEALLAYDQAIGLSPKDPYIYYHKGLTLQALGRSEDAYQSFAIARQLGHDGGD